MRTAAADYDPLYMRTADKTRFALPSVNPVLELKESGITIGVDVVRN